MEDIFSLIEKIFPVLIFIFWIIVSIIAGSRKNKKRAPVPTTPERTASAPQQQQQTVLTSKGQEDETKQERTVDDLKRKLESVFGELTFEHDDEEFDEPIEKSHKERPDTNLENMKPEHVPILAKIRVDEKKPVDINDVYGRDYINPDNASTAIFTSIPELRRAVILSEIIAPPVGLRVE